MKSVVQRIAVTFIKIDRINIDIIIVNLLDPNAVQWKKSCLVSKGKRKGELRVSSSAQAGKLAAESTRGSWLEMRP